MKPGSEAAPFGVVVNPSSALGRGKRVARHVLAALDSAGQHAIEIAGADGAECSAAIKSACAQGLRGLILVGGDGLIGLTLQLPEARELPIGIVPAGSGNDFARQFGLSANPARAVRHILACEARPQLVDLGVVTLQPEHREHWFAGGLSIGFDAAINRRANAIRLPIGPLRYQVALLAELFNLRSRPFTVSAPDSEGGGNVAVGTGENPGISTGAETEHRFTGLLATTMNTSAIGGGIPLTPSASVNDGLLDLIEVSHASKFRVLTVLGLLARGKHERLPEVRITRIRRARIEAYGEIAYADGERVGRGPFEVRVAPAALTLLG